MEGIDKEYDDYIRRRQLEGFPASAGNGRRPPSKGKFEPKHVPSGDNPIDPSLLKNDGKFDLPNNVYHSSGYDQRLQELGEDPLTTVRTMKNNMRRRALKYEDSDRPVKAHLCQAACDRLTRTEGELIQMQQKRSNAILVGDTKEAEKIKKDMEMVKEYAVRDTYADLVMDDDEMRAFGVNSKWTPDSQMPVSNGIPATSAKKEDPRKPPEGPFQPRTSVPVRVKTPKVQARKEEPSYAPSFVTTAKATEYDPEVRKNERLFSAKNSRPASKTMPRDYEDDPYQLPRSVGLGGGRQCPQCGQFASGNLDSHYKRECYVMNKCRYCQKIVMVSQLTDHYLRRCSFLGDTMTPCDKCGLAMHRKDLASGVGHPLCRGRTPPVGAQWCPHCSVAVNDNNKDWMNHLVNNCYDNPRRNGPDPEDPEPAPSTGPSNGSVSLNGRFIDADKLVVALQEIQMKKKKKKMEALAAAEAANAAT